MVTVRPLLQNLYMKKVTLLVLAGILFFNAQSKVITDTVSIGASYNNQVWYNMFGGVQRTAALADWDLAFDVSPMGYAIAINSANGVRVWKYRKADTSGWNTMDTTGLANWNPQWNSEYYWGLGAIGNYTNPNVMGDLDWGKYNTTTHAVTGDSLYIVRLANGTYKKLWIVSLVGVVFTFSYADMDGSNTQTINLNKTNYIGKNLAYYTIGTNSASDREPYSEDWDIMFSAATVLDGNPRTEAVVFSNSPTLVARYQGVYADNYRDYSNAVYSDSINTIGHTWKTGTGNSYTVQDSLLYFVQTQHGDIWKMVFKGFDGTSGGNYIFIKEQLNTVSVNDNTDVKTVSSMALYPNPSSGNDCRVVYNIANGVSKAVITINDMSGKLVHRNNLDVTGGLQQYLLPVQNLTSGVYIITVMTEGNNETGVLTQKLVIQ